MACSARSGLTFILTVPDLKGRHGLDKSVVVNIEEERFQVEYFRNYVTLYLEEKRGNKQRELLQDTPEYLQGVA